MLHKVLASLLALFTMAFCPAAFAGSYGEVQLAPSYKNTYTIATSAFTVVASPTDIFQIYGSSTKTVKILRIECRGITTTGYSNYPLFVLRRSTANSGGTSTTLTPRPLDTNSAAATCTAKNYTANPTTGSLVGTIVSTVANTADPTGTVVTNNVVFDADKYGQAIVLRGTSEGCVINLNGVSTPNTIDKMVITATVTEE